MEVISRKTRLDVKDGEYGRYLKIIRSDPIKPDRWMNLSAALWDKLVATIPEVEKIRRLEEEYPDGSYIELNDTTRIYVVDYAGYRYVGVDNTRKVEDKTYVHRINFTLIEWQRICRGAQAITEALAGNHVMKFYAAECEPDIYTPWHMELEQCQNARHEHGFIRMSFVQRPSALQWMENTIDYIFSKAIRDAVVENCNGCRIDHPSQRQHSCMMSDWCVSVDKYYDEIRHEMTYQKSIQIVTTVLNALGITVDKQALKNLYADKERITEMIKNAQILPQISDTLDHLLIK